MFIPDEELVSALDLGAKLCTGQNIPQAKHLVYTKLMQIRELLKEADQLRLHTLKELFSLLVPHQAAQCCLAGYELVFALRVLGSSASRESAVPAVPPSAIPVPVPVLVTSAASPARQPIAPDTLPLLDSLNLEVAPSLPPLVPVPIPLLLPADPSTSHLRTAASMTEAQLFANSFPVLAEQQANLSTSPPSPARVRLSQVPEGLVLDGGHVPPTFQPLDVEVLPVASKKECGPLDAISCLEIDKIFQCTNGTGRNVVG